MAKTKTKKAADWTAYGRLCMARDQAHPITPDKTVEVYAGDLDALLTHYATEADEQSIGLAKARALADASMEHAAAMRGFLLDLRSDLREPAEREGGLFRHFHQRVCEQLGMTPNDAVKPRSEAESA